MVVSLILNTTPRCSPIKRAGRRFYRIQLYTVITLHTQLNTAHLYMATTRHRTSLNVHNSIQHNSTRQNSTRHKSTHHNPTRPQLDTPQLYTDHMTVRLKLLYSSERYKQSVNVIISDKKVEIRTIHLFGSFATL